MGSGEVDESNAEDVAWMRLIGSGDEDAFAKLIIKHQHAVIGTIGKMTNFSADTEDLAQQVFLRIWKAAAKYQPTAKFTTYLFTITRNLVFNYTKKKSRTHERSLEEQQDEWHQQIADPSASVQPDERLEQSELRGAIDSAIQSLPEKQRLAVILRRYEHLPYEEIAAALDLSTSAVKSQLFRARTTLREQLKRFLEG
ncbi:MAG: RNA polymerase sigma factor [Akkermansiaceae bacterium]